MYLGEAMNISIVGGGNIGTQFAVHCAAKGHMVKIYTSKPEKFKNHLYIVDEYRNVILEANIEKATNNAEEAFSNADIIFITVPAFAIADIARTIEPFIRKGVFICIIPGTGGGECAFKSAMDKGAVLCGLQRVPSVARLVEYGSVVSAIGYRDELHIATLPCKYGEKFSVIISDIFEKKCSVLPNYLNLTMTPSNPILHTTRLKTIFNEYYEGVVCEELPLFYEEWSDETTKLLFKCDEEVQNLCIQMIDFDLSQVRSLKEHYESYSINEFTRKIQSIKGFKGLTTPSIKIDKGYIPDLNSRYFTADFSFGLTILIQLCDMVGVKAENMKETYNWYKKIKKESKEFKFSEYGIYDYEDLKNMYLR